MYTGIGWGGGGGTLARGVTKPGAGAGRFLNAVHFKTEVDSLSLMGEKELNNVTVIFRKFNLKITECV